MVPVNYRLKPDDISYIFDFAEVDLIIVDAEFEHLLEAFKKAHPSVPLIIDTVRFPNKLPWPELYFDGSSPRTRMRLRANLVDHSTMWF